MGRTLEIGTPDGPAEAYLARPDDDDHPGVLFFVDAIGLRPRIEEMADRIAVVGVRRARPERVPPRRSGGGPGPDHRPHRAREPRGVLPRRDGPGRAR